MSDFLALAPVDIISTLRTAPQNGAPSSRDYNDSAREILADLQSLSSYLNNEIGPLLATLAPGAVKGVDGSAIYANLTSSNIAFQDSAGNPLSIADVLSGILLRVDSVFRAVNNNTALVQQLQTRLASTAQNDLRNSVQSLTQAVNSLQLMMSGLNASVSTTKIGLDTLQKVIINAGVIATYTGYFVLTPVAGSAIIDLQNGLTHRLLISSDIPIAVPGPIFTGGNIIAGLEIKLYVDRDAGLSRPDPVFATGAGAFGTDANDPQIQQPLSRTTYSFSFDGNIWSVDNIRSGGSIS